MIYPNTVNELLQNWKIICNNRNAEGKPSDFFKKKQKQTLPQANQVLNVCLH